MVPLPLERAVFGLYATHAVHLADKHGIFSALAERDADSREIADFQSLDRETVERLLLVLRALEVVSCGTDGRYRLIPDMVPYLDATSSRYIGGFVQHLISSTATRMPQLDDYLLRGKVAVDAGLPAPFDVLYANPESTAEFLDAMWQLTVAVSDELVSFAELDDVRHLVDIGGASGAFAVAALRAHMDLDVTVFDLPPVQQHLEQKRRQHGLTDRLHFVAGNFFEDSAFPTADCFAFGYILSDWKDRTCLELLGKAHRSCAPGGRVLVMERLFDDDRRGPLATAVMNLSMHVETQGRHRTSGEYVDLLERAGFAHCEVYRSTGEKHLIVGHKRK